MEKRVEETEEIVNIRDEGTNISGIIQLSGGASIKLGGKEIGKRI